MNAIERIEKRWIRDAALQGLNVEEAGAVIDALALAVYADLSAQGAEEQAFDSASMSLPFGWAETKALSERAKKAGSSAAALKTEAEVLARVSVSAADIPKAVHEQVFGMIVAILVADRQLEDSEAALLTTFAHAFALSEEKAHGVYEEIVEAMGLEEG